ncbi:flagellar hook-basal body protein [Sulfurospirillum sp. T05]|uniref:Flagellar hook-basal body protein n=1 Tax=Sulfurospirillum tamanense TaxID=2813362 RepID=A0ABS2WSY4_9BACT|nr:flagellar hook-basal body protein [Sulfurospirillum tamanensis]MBN2964781.1 flagellar hook-basal body protein [Sulfurospirillum tamanensis]
MQNGFYVATGAMVTQFNKLDVISNNLANINTPAFKRDDVVIADFSRIYQEVRDELPLRNHTKEAAKFINRNIDRVPQVSEQYVTFSQGGVKATGNPFDFALKRDDAFFMVETPQGIRLTQNGAFTLNEEGILSTKEGYPVLPANFFQTNQYIEFAPEATVTADANGNLYADGDVVNALYIAQAEDPRRLTKEGDHLYIFEDENQVRALEEADVVAQGFLEMSNVNPVREMVGLIEAQRMVEMYQKVMTSHMDDLNSEAINKLANVKG